MADTEVLDATTTSMVIENMDGPKIGIVSYLGVDVNNRVQCLMNQGYRWLIDSNDDGTIYIRVPGSNPQYVAPGPRPFYIAVLQASPFAWTLSAPLTQSTMLSFRDDDGTTYYMYGNAGGEDVEFGTDGIPGGGFSWKGLPVE